MAAPHQVRTPSQDVWEGLSSGNSGFAAQTSGRSACAEIRGHPHGEWTLPAHWLRVQAACAGAEGAWAPWEPLTTPLHPPDLFPCPLSYEKPSKIQPCSATPVLCPEHGSVSSVALGADCWTDEEREVLGWVLNENVGCPVKSEFQVNEEWSQYSGRTHGKSCCHGNCLAQSHVAGGWLSHSEGQGKSGLEPGPLVHLSQWPGGGRETWSAEKALRRA